MEDCIEMKRLLLTTALLVGLVATAIGEDQPKIVAPAEVDAGQLIVAKVESETLSAAWMPVEPFDLDFRVYGNELVASSGISAGNIIIMCSVIDWENHLQQFHRIMVKVNGEVKPNPKPDPKPDPNPDPAPPPGDRNVLIIHESADNSTEFILTSRGVQDYCRAEGHRYLCLDDDQPHDMVIEGLAAIKEAKVKLPAMIVSCEYNGQTYQAITALPPTKQEAIAFIQEAGG